MDAETARCTCTNITRGLQDAKVPIEKGIDLKYKIKTISNL